MSNRVWVVRPNGKPAIVVECGIARNRIDQEGNRITVRRCRVEWVNKRGEVRRAWYDETEVREVTCA